MSRRQSGRGHARKHAGNHKAKHQPHASSKHNQQHQHKPPFAGGQPVLVSVKMRHSGPARARGWSPGADVDCCAAQALGALLGLPDAEVLELYWATTGDPDTGATIADTLEAANLQQRAVKVIGSAASYRAWILGVTLPEPHAIAVTPDGTWWSWGEPFDPADWPELVIEESWAVSL